VSAVRAAVRGTGELLITAGLVLLLFCVYQLVWTNVEAKQRQDAVTRGITDDWRRAGPTPTGGQLAAADFGKGFAFLRIPRLGRDFTVPVVEGVRTADLARGVGHYPTTAAPGGIGNFAVAGHRATHGEPFRDLDRMRPGDAVVVETKDTWYTYVVDRTRIVAPTDVWVIDPVPGQDGVAPTQRLLTLTTCNPRWASTQRLIVFAHLADQQLKAAGAPSVLSAVGR
jgi:sortase A